MKTLTSGLLALCFVITSMVSNSSQAEVYGVNRTFTEGITTASLVGTVNVPLGHYVIQNTAPNPFTAVNLTLTVNAGSYNLTHALTDIIQGTGQFTIDATATTLTFSASGNGSNPADLVFSDNTDASLNNRYVIGSNGNPAFEVAYTNTGQVLGDMSYPVVFGTLIPEPSSFILLAVAMIGVGLKWRRSSRVACK